MKRRDPATTKRDLATTRRDLAALAALGLLVLALAACDQESERIAPAPLESGLQDALEIWLADHGRSPRDYVLGLFADHDVVFLGEQHRIRHDLLFVQELVGHLDAAGVRVFATEFARRVDQALVDSLIAGETWDEALAREIQLRQWAPWGFREYLDVWRAVWRANRDRPAGTRPLRLVGLNNAPDFSVVEKPEDIENPEIAARVFGDETEADWAAPILAAVAAGEKVLVHCGIHHAFTRYRQPRVTDGEFVAWGRLRCGNHVAAALRERACTVYLHAPWPGRGGYDSAFVHPAAGRLDAFMLARADGPFAVGFDVADSPLGGMPVDDTVYAVGYDLFTMATFCDGWIYTKPIAEYEGVTYIEGWIHPANLERARRGVMNATMRTYDAERFDRACAAEADIMVRLGARLR